MTPQAQVAFVLQARPPTRTRSAPALNLRPKQREAFRRLLIHLAFVHWLEGLAEQIRCGGDLPPCYVLARESGGDPRAQNPISTASGLWQFLDTTWNGFDGYQHAREAPISVQNEKAREVWADGAGASHWACC